MAISAPRERRPPSFFPPSFSILVRVPSPSSILRGCGIGTETLPPPLLFFRRGFFLQERHRRRGDVGSDQHRTTTRPGPDGEGFTDELNKTSFVFDAPLLTIRSNSKIRHIGESRILCPPSPTPSLKRAHSDPAWHHQELSRR